MKRDPWLSERVQDFIETEDHFADSDLPAEERVEAQKNRKFVDIVVKSVITSRESLGGDSFKVIERLVQAEPELIEHFLNDHFTREVVNAVPGYVERMMQLSRLEAQRKASKVTNVFLREAVRTYILGLPQASVALCRAALEQALKESLGRQLSGDFISFQDLLSEARRWHILDPTTENMARDVANAGDKVLHAEPTDLRQAEEALMKVRAQLQHNYSVDGKI